MADRGAAREMTGYGIGEHRHRFAVWAAARASQRRASGLSTSALLRAFERTPLPALVSAGPASWPATATAVDNLHRETCRDFLTALDEAQVQSSYGRAAKFVAIYLKAMVVNAGFAETPFGRLAHPPIDRLLLTALRRDRALPLAERRAWATNWTDLDEGAYFALIDSLRRAGLDQPAFWTIERYWTPDGA